MKDEDVRIGMRVVLSNTTGYPCMYVTGSFPDNFDRVKNPTVWILDTKPVSGEFDGAPYYAEEFEPYINVKNELHQEKEEKVIVAQWIPEDTYGYGRAMRVIQSNHPRFSVGCRFDYGFTGIAGDEGYTVIIKPMEDKGE